MLLDFIVCDDVRNEVGEKSTLVGVYGEIVRIAAPEGQALSWPILMAKLGVFLRTKPVQEFVPDRFALSFTHNGVQVGRFEGELKVADPGRPYTLAVVASPFPLPGPGKLQFHLTFKKGDMTKQVPIDRTIAIEIEGSNAVGSAEGSEAENPQRPKEL
jgi:hypothetical protein